MFRKYKTVALNSAGLSFSANVSQNIEEINRGNHLEAFGFYLGFTIQPLVEMLRIVYAPHHSTFGTRYIQYDLPSPIVQQLTPFYFMANAEALKQNFAAAKKFFAEATQEAYKKYRLTKQVG